jgi:hypothetical protein
MFNLMAPLRRDRNPGRTIGGYHDAVSSIAKRVGYSQHACEMRQCGTGHC